MLSRLTKITAIALSLTMIGHGAFAQGTMQQQNACRPDVFRLCGSYIPNVDAIVACLRNNAPNLSEPCHEVMFPDHVDEGSYEQTSRVRSGELH